MTRRLLATLALAAAITQLSHAQTSSWRPTIVAQHGMVAAGHPLAAEAGMRDPQGRRQRHRRGDRDLGGAGRGRAGHDRARRRHVRPHLHREDGEVKFINGTGFAPQAATIDFYKVKGGMPDEAAVVDRGAGRGRRRGARAADLRHQVAGRSARAGHRDRRERLSDHRGARARPGRAARRSSAKYPVVHEDLVQGRQAARDGRRACATRTWPDAARDRRPGPRRVLHRATSPRNTAAFLKANGGIITEADLAGYAPFEDAPIHINYRGVDVYECPPNSQGFVMLEALNILEGFNAALHGAQQRAVPARGHRSRSSWRSPIATRTSADPKFVPNIPMREMLSKEYAAIRRAPDRSEPRDRRRGAARRSTRR